MGARVPDRIDPHGRIIEEFRCCNSGDSAQFERMGRGPVTKGAWVGRGGTNRESIRTRTHDACNVVVRACTAPAETRHGEAARSPRWLPPRALPGLLHRDAAGLDCTDDAGRRRGRNDDGRDLGQRGDDEWRSGEQFLGRCENDRFS